MSRNLYLFREIQGALSEGKKILAADAASMSVEAVVNHEILGEQDARAAGTSGIDVDSLDRPVSVRGKRASFGDAEVECMRVLNLQHNYYAVLKVTKSTPHTELHFNWSRLRRVVKPESDSDALAGAATAICDAAFATLKDPIKKALYDQYICQTDAPDGMSYEEWEDSLRGVHANIPKLVHWILNCPGGTVVTCCILVPGLVSAVLITGLVWLAVMPFRLAWRGMMHCHSTSGIQSWPGKMRSKEEAGQEEADAADWCTPGRTPWTSCS